MIQFVMLNLAGYRWSRADQAHVSLEHIEELRYFIEAVLAQEAPYAGDAWIKTKFKEQAIALVEMKQFVPQRVGVLDHGAEFVAGEDYPSLAGARRPIQDRAG